jgi:enoyl-[acyl-carrier protein] reductase I
MDSGKTSVRGLGLERKDVVVLGVADETSIAWGIAESFLQCGARVTIGYQQKFFSRVRLLFQKYQRLQGARCDVLNDAELKAFFDSLGDRQIDVLVHAIAYGPPEIFTRPPSEVETEASLQSMLISAFSLPKIVRFAKPRLANWSSVMALSFQASERATPFYGMMGVSKSALESLARYLAVELGELKARVNIISSGPVETLAAMGIILAFSRDPEALNRIPGSLLREAMQAATSENRGLRETDELAWAKAVWGHVQKTFAHHCPLNEPICKEDIAGCALFLGSDLSRKITGQVVRVDCGLSSSLMI